MPISKSDIDRLRKVFDIPEFVDPWLDRFFTPEEIALVLLLSEKNMSIAEIEARQANFAEDNNINTLNAFLERCRKRGLVIKTEEDLFQPADFHERFDSWALFEGWMDLPDDVRVRLNAWELEYYHRQHVDQIRTLKGGKYQDPSLTWPAYVLLPEAMVLLDQADHVYLWPCNCRSMMERCTKNIYTCIRFDNNRDAGWEISRSRAKDIVHRANKSGLMQNAEIALDSDGSISGAICNCCADCCFPHQLAGQLEAAGLWPLSRYVAAHLADRCIACGRCAKRCPFEAFRYSNINALQPDGSPKGRRSIFFERSLCRGCGVCSTGCPENAIEMIRLERVKAPWENLLQNQLR